MTKRSHTSAAASGQPPAKKTKPDCGAITELLGKTTIEEILQAREDAGEDIVTLAHNMTIGEALEVKLFVLRMNSAARTPKTVLPDCTVVFDSWQIFGK